MKADSSPHVRFVIGTLGLALLFGPWVGAALGARSDPDPTENRALAQRPTWRGFATLQDITDFAADRFPLRDNAIRANARLGDAAGAKGSGATNGLVLRGRAGWLYLTEDFSRACSPDRPTKETIARLRRLNDIITGSGRRLVVSIIPDKSTFQTAYLPDAYANQKCAEATRDDRFERLRDLGLPGYVDVAPLLRRDEKLTGDPAFQKTDTHWTDRSSALFVKAIVETIDPSLAQGTRLVAGRFKSKRTDLALLSGDRDERADRVYKIERAGVRSVIETEALAPGDAFTVRRITATTTGPAPLFQPRTLWIGDSFSDRAVQHFSQYFADLVATPDLTRAASIGEAATGEDLYSILLQRLVDGITNAEVIVIEAVERFFFGTTLGSMLNADFLDRLEAAL